MWWDKDRIPPLVDVEEEVPEDRILPSVDVEEEVPEEGDTESTGEDNGSTQ